jgi:glycosyltransferase involved in cell wall biosynthesis
MPRIAIVHEWFTTLAGSESVVEVLCSLYPSADVFALYADPVVAGKTPYLQGRKLQTSFIQNLPFAARSFRSYLPLMPLAIEQFDLSSYDIVISSNHAVAKGVLTGPDQLHISYVHSPMRYAWDLQHQYLRESGLDRGLKGWITKWMLHKIRLWDTRTAHGVDHFIANSMFIGRRIKKAYGRPSDVIYPPVDVGTFALCENKQDFYLAASRLVPYKKMDMIVEAFAAMPEKRLVVIGDGPEMPKLKAKATPNVELLGYQPTAQLKRMMQDAKAFVFAAEEDFGITPVEAQACGTPVIAFGKGGATETVVDQDPAPTGLFFDTQTVAALCDAVERFEASGGRFLPANCRANAERFSTDRFRTELSIFINEKWLEFQSESGRRDACTLLS